MPHKLLHEDLTYYLRGVAFLIHSELKSGHKEEFYEKAYIWVLDRDGVAFRQQPVYKMDYEGHQVGEYRPDLVIESNKLLIDFKSTPKIIALHKAQMLSYLAVTEIDLGLIMNFGSSSMQFERIPNFVRERDPFEWTPQPVTDGSYPELRNAIALAVYKVHYTLGAGFLSQVYRRATYIELGRQGVSFEYLTSLPLSFDGNTIAEVHTNLFWIDKKILLATFALQSIPAHVSEKMRWAMKVTDCQIGMLVNFYPSKLEIRVLR